MRLSFIHATLIGLAFGAVSFVPGKPKKVYICDSSTAYAYHKKEECKGLKECTHEVKLIKKADAPIKGYKACKLCYKHL